MTDQQLPGPGDDQSTPSGTPDDRAVARAGEPTRPLRRPVTPDDEPTVPTSRADLGLPGPGGEATTAGPGRAEWEAAETADEQAERSAERQAAERDTGATAGEPAIDDGETLRLTPPRPDEEPTARLQPPTPVAPATEETRRLTEAQVRAASRPAGPGPAPAAGRSTDQEPSPAAGRPTDQEPPRAAGRPADLDRASGLGRAVDDARTGARGTGEEPGRVADDGEPVATSPDAVRPEPGRVPEGKAAPWQRLSSAGALIWVLLALFGFTLVVQLRSNDTDQGLAGARQDDLVRILSDLEARDTRLQAEIAGLEGSRQQLTSGVAGREAALAEAEKRADELGLLAGTLPGSGSGLVIRVDRVKASEILNAVQELRGAGGEVMQISGGGAAVRIVASTYFVDGGDGAIVVDGTRLTGPYTLTVIGVPQTMQTALEIPGGVVASVQSDGGSVTMEQRISVEVTAVREATSLQYARPVS